MLWRQLCADLFGRPVALTATVDATAYGAALLAAVGAGAFPGVGDACQAWVTVQSPLSPGSDAPLLQVSRMVKAMDVVTQQETRAQGSRGACSG